MGFLPLGCLFGSMRPLISEKSKTTDRILLKTFDSQTKATLQRIPLLSFVLSGVAEEQCAAGGVDVWPCVCVLGHAAQECWAE